MANRALSVTKGLQLEGYLRSFSGSAGGGVAARRWRGSPFRPPETPLRLPARACACPSSARLLSSNAPMSVHLSGRLHRPSSVTVTCFREDADTANWSTPVQAIGVSGVERDVAEPQPVRLRREPSVDRGRFEPEGVALRPRSSPDPPRPPSRESTEPGARVVDESVAEREIERILTGAIAHETLRVTGWASDRDAQ